MSSQSSTSSLKSDFIKVAKLTLVALVLTLGANYIFADWTAPGSTPPTCVSGSAGCDAPLNVSTTNQAKDAGLALGTNSTATLGSATGPSGPSLDVEGGGLYANAIASPSATFTNVTLATTTLNGTILVGLDSGRYTPYTGCAGTPSCSPGGGNGDVLTYFNGYATWSPPVSGSSVQYALAEDDIYNGNVYNKVLVGPSSAFASLNDTGTTVNAGDGTTVRTVAGPACNASGGFYPVGAWNGTNSASGNEFNMWTFVDGSGNYGIGNVNQYGRTTQDQMYVACMN